MEVQVALQACQGSSIGTTAPEYSPAGLRHCKAFHHARAHSPGPYQSCMHAHCMHAWATSSQAKSIHPLTVAQFFSILRMIAWAGARALQQGAGGWCSMQGSQTLACSLPARPLSRPPCMRQGHPRQRRQRPPWSLATHLCQRRRGLASWTVMRGGTP